MTREGAATAQSSALGQVRSDAAAALRALHRVVLDLAAPLGFDAGAVGPRFARLVGGAVEALGAAAGMLILQREPAWDAFLVDTEGDADDPRVLVVQADGRIERWHGRPDSPPARVLRSGQALYVADVDAPSPMGPFPGMMRLGIRAFAAVPLRLGGEVPGALCVGYAAPYTLDAAQRELLDLFAAHGAALVERARRVYAERRRADQQRRLTAILAELAAATGLEDALTRLTQGVVPLLGGVQGTARVYAQPPGQDAGAASPDRTASVQGTVPDGGADAVRVIVHEDGTLETRRKASRLRSGSFAAALFAGAPAALVVDMWALDPAAYPHVRSARRERVRSSVNVPIEAGGQRIGSLHVDHPQPGFFSHADLLVAQALAAHAGAAIERLRTEEVQRTTTASQARLDGALLVARTVAHEINNAISPVLGFAELLALRPAVAADPSAAAYTRHIADAATETAAKIRRLQQIVRLEHADIAFGDGVSVLDLERSAQPDSGR